MLFFKKLINKFNHSVTGGAVIIAVFSVLSKILGLIRDRLLASNFGAGDVLDAYYAAFKLPDLIFNTLVLGALSAAFIPVFVSLKHKSIKALKHESIQDFKSEIQNPKLVLDPDRGSKINSKLKIQNLESSFVSDFEQNQKSKIKNQKSINHWQLASAVMNIIFLVLLILSIIFFIFAPGFMKLIAPGFSGDKLALTVKLTRIMLASILFFGISNVLSGVLQSFKKFAIFSAAPIMYNLGIIAGIILLVDKMGPVGLAWGVVLGAGLHMLVQIPSAIKVGFKWRPVLAWKDGTIRKIGRLMLPRTLGLAVTQINQLIITIIASTLAAGSIAVFNLAFNLQTVPISIFAVSMAIASFPALSESRAENNQVKFVIQFSTTVRRILFLIVPVSIFMIALRAQMVRLFYGAGQFDWQDTILTADAVGYFCLSLFAQGLIVLLARAFYAYHDTKTPVIIGLVSVLINIAGSIWLGRIMGVAGLALSFSISSMINMILLGVWLKRKIGWLDEKNIAFAVLKNITAALGGVIFIQITKYSVGSAVDMRTFWGVFIQFASAGAVGTVVYLAVSWILGSEEIKKIRELFKIKTD